MTNKKIILSGLKYLVFLLIFFSSCATGSRAIDTFLDSQDDFAALAEGGSIYIYIDMQKARPILENVPLPGTEGANKKQIEDMFNRTSSAVVAYYPENAPRRFHLAARGSYPSSGANMAFTFNSAWKRQRSEIGANYWRSERDGLSISLRSRRAFVSDGDPFTNPPGASSPAGFDLFRKETAIAGWIEDIASPLNRYLESLELPIQIPAGRTLFALYPIENKYFAKLNLETSSPSQARGLATVMNIARVFITAMPQNDQTIFIKALFTNSVKYDGNYINIETSPLSETEIASILLSMLSSYSK